MLTFHLSLIYYFMKVHVNTLATEKKPKIGIEYFLLALK